MRAARRGRIGIYNRSHYEEVLVVRVHRTCSARSDCPRRQRKARIWNRRYREINDWERYLVENGVQVVKIILNVSKTEQAKRFLADRPAGKELEVLANDVSERRYWDDYPSAFNRMLSQRARNGHPGTSSRPIKVVQPPRDRGGPRESAQRDRPEVPGR